MAFDASLSPCDENGDLREGDEQATKELAVIEKLAFGNCDGKTWQLALIWLAGHDYSDMLVEDLAAELFRLRKTR